MEQRRSAEPLLPRVQQLEDRLNAAFRRLEFQEAAIRLLAQDSWTKNQVRFLLQRGYDSMAGPLTTEPVTTADHSGVPVQDSTPPPTPPLSRLGRADIASGPVELSSSCVHLWEPSQALFQEPGPWKLYLRCRNCLVFAASEVTVVRAAAPMSLTFQNQGSPVSDASTPAESPFLREEL